MTPEQIAHREKTIEQYIRSYVSLIKESDKVEVVINATEAARSIVALYDRYAEEIIRPSINPNIITSFRIVANTELAILRVRPFENIDRSKEKSINARLAFYVALRILIEWHSFKEDDVNDLLNDDFELRAFVSEHYKWLFLLDTTKQYPVFSNAQIWRLFYYLIRDRTKIINM